MDQDKKLDINWFDPFWQTGPSTIAILNFLRIWSGHFTPVDRELTDAEWTAFRALATYGAAEGLIRMTYTHVLQGPIVEEMRVQGEYTKAMGAEQTILSDEPLEIRLVQGRLTARGEQWSQYLKREASDAVKARGFVLALLWKSERKEGTVRITKRASQSIPAPRHNSSSAETNSTVPRHGDIVMGDKYEIGQGGAIGPNAHAHHISFQQSRSQSGPETDLETLVVELAKLRKAMRALGDDRDHDLAIGAVAAAQQAAEKGDGPGILSHLKNAGDFALKTAKDIGVEIAASVIAKAMGV